MLCPSCSNKIGLHHQHGFRGSGAGVSAARRLHRLQRSGLLADQGDASGLLPFRHTVNSLVPGTIYTPFVEGYLKKHYADDPEKAVDNLKKRQLSETFGTVAYAALYLLPMRLNYIYGSGLMVDGGFSVGKIFD